MDKYDSQNPKSLFVWLAQLAVAALYLFFGLIMHQAFTVHSIVSVIWPGCGLALAALLIGGRRYILGVGIGSLVLNVIANNSIWAIGGITLADISVALAAYWILTRNGQTVHLRTLTDYLRLVILGGAIASTVGAVIGASSILLAGYITQANFAENVYHWWMGDTLGVALVAPLVLVWQQEWREAIPHRRLLEGLLLMSGALFFGQIAFFDWFHQYFADSPRSYLLFPCIALVAIRMGSRGSTLAALLISSQALIGAYLGMGTFAHDIAKNLQNYWVYSLALSVVGMIVATNARELKHAFDALHDSEQRYHLLFDTNPLPMWVFDEASLKFLVVNNRAVEHYGYTREEFSRMTLRDIRQVEKLSELDQIFSSTSGKSFSAEVRHKKKDGTIIDVSIYVQPIMYGNTRARITTVKDITERKNAEKALQKNSMLLNTSQLLSKVGGWEFDVATGISEWTEGLYKLHEFPLDSDMDHVAESLKCYKPEDRTIVFDAFKRAAEEGKAYDLEFPFTTFKGRALWIRTTCQPVYENGKVVRLIGNLMDITERKEYEKKLQDKEASLRAILDNVPYLIWLKDIDGRFIAVNKSFFNTTGRASTDEVLGKTDFDLWPRVLAEKYHATDAEVISSRQHKTIEEMSLDKGKVQWVETFKAPILDQNGNVLGTTGFARDITEQKQSEDRVQHMAYYDSLTDLPNRKLLSDRLQQAISLANRDKEHLAVMFIDLDNFKPINDELGHYVGDLLLKEVTKRMQDCVRESDTVARIGGDEFIILLPNIETAQDAILVAEKIRYSLNQPFMLVGQSLNISSSVGIAVYPEHGKDETQLVKNADTAMYNAKAGGRNNVSLYQPDFKDG